jgi:hypothetical protein
MIPVDMVGWLIRLVCKFFERFEEKVFNINEKSFQKLFFEIYFMIFWLKL